MALSNASHNARTCSSSDCKLPRWQACKDRVRQAAVESCTLHRSCQRAINPRRCNLNSLVNVRTSLMTRSRSSNPSLQTAAAPRSRSFFSSRSVGHLYNMPLSGSRISGQHDGIAPVEFGWLIQSSLPEVDRGYCFIVGRDSGKAGITCCEKR